MDSVTRKSGDISDPEGPGYADWGQAMCCYFHWSCCNQTRGADVSPRGSGSF
jgi:hypothetical protein